ncbi:MAG: membrane protein insertase YidC [Candidatus Zixiibacteriota bacterium]|nr:MAG: membrane protein insertase YidC [candidate division Zixibacteria bacterium]
MDKKTVILIILLGLLVIFWMPIMTRLGLLKPAPQPIRQPGTEQPVQQAPADTAQRPLLPERQQVMPTRQDTAATLAAADTVIDIPEELITVETGIWEITLTNHGGGPISFKLTDYKYEDGTPIQMLPDCEVATPSFTYLGGTLPGNSLAYRASRPAGRYTVTNTPLELTYTYEKEGGGAISKRYRFYPDRYDYDLILEISDRPGLGFERNYIIEWNNRLGPTELNIGDDYNAMWAMAYQGGEHYKFDDFNNNILNENVPGNTGWIANRSKYFTAILIPRSQPGEAAQAYGVREKIQSRQGAVTARAISTGITMPLEYAPSITDSFSVFVGPIDYGVLSKYNNEIVDLIDIGTTPFVGWIIRIFAVPIMWLLPRMYDIIPNYGLVIIIFSLLIKVVTFPLTKKTLKSMLGMRELQPKMEELKKKHKNNPQALNREMMKLYKEMGINPLSGCLPMLPQMPLFFALFSVFRSTILLRQAPFILWWNDLSRGALSLTDPYMILVILMVGLMFLQQKTGMTDPKNKALTYIFPLMLGFFFYKASAGLVLYWTCFSLFSFIEQIVYKRPMMEKAEAQKQTA